MDRFLLCLWTCLVLWGCSFRLLSVCVHWLPVVNTTPSHDCEKVSKQILFLFPWPCSTFLSVFVCALDALVSWPTELTVDHFPPGTHSFRMCMHCSASYKSSLTFSPYYCAIAIAQ